MTEEFDNLFPGGETTTADQENPWKIIIADDEEDVHQVTKLALQGVNYLGRPLQFLSAHGTTETIALCQAHPDTALILLDVVMEDENSGLQLIQEIRQHLNNHHIRIALRTGQPGIAPERQVIVDYDIDYYLAKSELTSDKLFTTVIASLRAYANLLKISEELSSATIKCVQVGIMVVDQPSSRIMDVNPAAREILTLAEDANERKKTGTLGQI